MRPPYGDIDDRVRAISLAMGMVPVIWTRTPSGATFDTNGETHFKSETLPPLTARQTGKFPVAL